MLHHLGFLLLGVAGQARSERLSRLQRGGMQLNPWSHCVIWMGILLWDMRVCALLRTLFHSCRFEETEVVSTYIWVQVQPEKPFHVEQIQILLAMGREVSHEEVPFSRASCMDLLRGWGRTSFCWSAALVACSCLSLWTSFFGSSWLVTISLEYSKSWLMTGAWSASVILVEAKNSQHL